MTIETVVAEAVGRIEATHAARERALSASRALVRQCANAIRAVHRAEFETAEALLREATQTAQGLRGGLGEQSGLLFAGYTQDALKEYAEAALVYAFLHGDPPPSAEAPAGRAGRLPERPGRGGLRAAPRHPGWPAPRPGARAARRC